MGNLAENQDDIRTEMIHGQLIAMFPRPSLNHNRIIVNVARIFSNYLVGKKCAERNE